MPEEMRAELQMVYKNAVDNLAAIKKQQWIVSSYAVALFAGIGGLAHSMKPPPSQQASCWLTTLIVIGILASWYFLIKMQCDSTRERTTLQCILKRYFSLEERNFFSMGYNDIPTHHLEYLAAFMAVSAIAGGLVIWSLYLPPVACS